MIFILLFVGKCHKKLPIGMIYDFLVCLRTGSNPADNKLFQSHIRLEIACFITSRQEQLLPQVKIINVIFYHKHRYYN